MSRPLLQQNHNSGTASVDKLNVNSRIMVGGPIVPQTGKGNVVRVDSQLWVGGDMAAVAKTSDYNKHTTWSYTPIAPLTWAPVPTTVSHALDLLQAASSGVGMLPLTNGNIYVGDPTNMAADVSLTGDALITNTGIINVKQISGNALGGTGMNITSTSGSNGSAYFGFTGSAPSGVRSVGIGYQANNISTGTDNVVLGSEAGKFNIIANKSTIIGARAGNIASTGEENTFIGYNSGTATDTFGTGLFNSISSRVVCIGSQAALVGGTSVSDGSIVVGWRARTSGLENTLIGYDGISTGDNSVGIGSDVNCAAISVCIGSNSAAGAESVVIGYDAGSLNTGLGSILIGSNTSSNSPTTVDSIIIGRNSSAGTGENTIHIGANSGIDSNSDSGPYNVSIGGSSLNASGGCAQNALVGGLTGLLLYSGSNNAVLGYNAFSSATGNDQNVAIGSESLVNAVSTTYSVGTITIDMSGVVVGFGTTFTPSMVGGYIVANQFTYKIVSFIDITTLTSTRFHTFDVAVATTYVIHYNGWHNTVVGYGSGNTLTDGNDNTIIGYQADVDNATRSGAVALGQGIIANVDNGFFVKHRNSVTPTSALVSVYDSSSNELVGLPDAGVSGQVLTSNASGTLSWTTPVGIDLTVKQAAMYGTLLDVSSIYAATGGTSSTGQFAGVDFTNSTIFDLNNSVLTGDVNGTILTVTSISSGSIMVNQTISGPGITSGTKIVAFVSGTRGGAGIYTVDLSSPATGSITINSVHVVIVGDRILIKDQTDSKQNGVYIVLTSGASGTMERSSDMDGTPASEVMSGIFIFVTLGYQLANSGWVLEGSGTLTLNTDNLFWAQFNGTGDITQGTGISITGNQIATNNSLNGGISANTTSNFLDFDTGNNSSILGNLPVSNGGTGSALSLVVGDILYANTTTSLTKLGVGIDNQVLTVAGGLPTWATPATTTVALDFPNNYYAQLAGVPIGGMYRSNFNSSITPISMTASFTGVNTLDVTVITGTPIIVGALVTGTAGLVDGTYISGFLTGSGGIGTYTTSNTNIVGTITSAGVLSSTNPDIIYIRSV